MKIFYEEENIRAIAEKIRDKANVDTTYTTAEMPSGVDEVYNKGYADGEANGTGGEAIPVLYGTHMLKTSITHASSAVSKKVNNVEGWFFDGNTVYQDSITEIVINSTGVYLLSSTNKARIEFPKGSAGEWKYYYNGVYYNVPDNRHLIIEFKEPNEVSQEFYDLFMAIVNNSTSTTPYSVGEEVGKQAQYNEFWDAALNPQLNWQQRFTGAVWNDITFKPNQDIKPKGYANHLFNLAEITDLVAILQECGVTLDTSGINQRGDRMFNWCTKLTTVPYIDVSNVTNESGITEMFICCYALHTIEGLRLRDDGSLAMENAFEQCKSLVNLTIEGTIGTSGLNLRHSINLSKASIISVLNALSDSTSGLSITLSLKAVNSAFTNGVNSSLWQEWVHDKSNWTINLV